MYGYIWLRGEREREREREREDSKREREREREREGEGERERGGGEREKKGVGGESGHVCGRKTVHVSACNSLARVRDTTEAIETSKAGSKS